MLPRPTRNNSSPIFVLCEKANCIAVKFLLEFSTDTTLHWIRTMAHSCSNNTGTQPKAVCPVNGQSYSQVSRRTVLHQVRKPWQRDLTAQKYYYCDDPNCDVVYFGNDRQVILQNELRQSVGQKSYAPDRPVCYCFDILMSDLQTEQEHDILKTFVAEKTKQTACDCEIRNPSGKCCLKDFPD